MTEDTTSATTTFSLDTGNWTLLSQGAEARVWKSSSAGMILCKERFPKKYRHPVLDQRLTKQRCRMEARILQKCYSKNIVAVPNVLRVQESLIYMECIQGPSVREFLEEQQSLLDSDETDTQPPSLLEDVALQMGQALAQLHNHGIIHGDLTSSNMMLRQGGDHKQQHELVLIDFGLAKNSTAAEEKAVDLYVLERALASTHASLPAFFWKRVLEVYGQEQEMGVKKKQDTLVRLEQVRQRGRKRECFG